MQMSEPLGAEGTLAHRQALGCPCQLGLERQLPTLPVCSAAGTAAGMS